MFEKSATRRVRVERPAGLHARPCLAIATTVSRFQAAVEVCCGGRKADGRSVLELLSLGAGEGQEVAFSAKGPDGEQVLDALVALFQDNFGLSDE